MLQDHSQIDCALSPVPHGHLFETVGQVHLLLSNGSRIYGLTDDVAGLFEDAMVDGDPVEVESLLVEHGLDAPPYIDDTPPESFPLRGLSLAVAQKCNLGCSYCYAAGGDFGGPGRNMSEEVALAAVERLIDDCEPGGRANLAFMGGEPLANRAVIRTATELAAARAAEKGVRLGLSITTNGTLVEPEDGVFFEEHGFAVTVSLDGLEEAHDRQRPFKNGGASFRRITKRIKPLLAMQRRMQVSARVTVTPQNMDLRETLDGLIGLGFHSVGFSPMLSASNGKGEMDEAALEDMLQRMIDCGDVFLVHTEAGRRYPFSNLATALHEIHRGTHRPYPCGAGAGYMGVSADGGLFACHRFVDDAPSAMGSVTNGVDKSRQTDWLAVNHVHVQEPCKDCWARYLCGGGCYHEVRGRGRPACDYIRGWLHYCLQSYVRLLDSRPDFFGLPEEETYIVRS